MPKARMYDGGSWRNEPATEAQIKRLYALLIEAEIISPKRGEDWENWEGEAVSWANEYLAGDIRRLDDLTKGEIQMLFGHLE